ncbi:cadherin-like beta sandwich domain-containing protein [Lysinibacillus sp. FSL H8-0500]|uniref:cadherin-like beta sandwich domain-containing protein n=1 Tax=Lysinibacillus sp. FSL H8-0500 TaxID=2921393 RepID=UPI003101A5D3
MSGKKLRLFVLLYIVLQFSLVVFSSVEASEAGKFRTVLTGFNQPEGIAVDKDGNIYVIDARDNCILKFKSDNSFLNKWCNQIGGQSISYPKGIAVDAAGNIYITNSNNSTIQKFRADGTHIMDWGGYGTAIGQFNNPSSIAIDIADNLYIADTYNKRIQKFTSNGVYVMHFDIEYSPYNITVDKLGNIYTTNLDVLRKYKADGTYLMKFNGSFNFPDGIATDADNNIYVVDKMRHCIQKYAANGTHLAQWGAQGKGDGQFLYPTQIASDTAGNLYVTDRDNKRVQKMTPLPSNTNLASLKVGEATLSPSPNYQVEVGNDVSMQTIIATSSDPLAKINIEGQPPSIGTLSYQANLNVGDNVIPIVVTAQDGYSKKTYTLTIKRLPSNEATLKSLTVNHGTLNPMFAANEETYTLQVEHAVAALQITAETTNNGARMTINGNRKTSETIALVAGQTTTIPIVVTAQNGMTQKTYTLAVTRALSDDATLKSIMVDHGTLSPAFMASEETYTLQVAHAVAALQITAETTNNGASMTINGSEKTSETIALVAGQTITIPIVVTAQNGMIQKTYTLAITRALSDDATLKSITVDHGTLSPAFTANEETYTLQVEHSVPAINVVALPLDNQASVTINGRQKTSEIILLIAGQATQVPIVVTAQDGETQKTYTMIVMRAPSNDATLQSLIVEHGILNPSFNSSVTMYTVQPDLTAATLQVTALPTNVDASVMINGKTTTADTVTLTTEHSMTIPIVVTAQSGEQSVYTLLVQEPSIPVTSVRLQPEKFQLQVGSNPVALTATIYPSNASNQRVSWRSTNPVIATVDEYGMVTAKSAGKTEIVVTTADGGQTATALVVVEEIPTRNEPLPSPTPTQQPINDNDFSPPSTVKIILYANNGTVLEPIEITYNTRVSDLPVPTREGYQFDGWYQDESLTTPWVVEMLVREDIVLYAKWIALPVEELEPLQESQQPPKPVERFEDIERHWAQEMIEELVTRDIIQGYEDGTFRPNEAISRQHVVALLTRAFSFESVRSTDDFSDVSPMNPYYEAIRTLQQAGIIDGAEGMFLPTENTTRAQLAKVLVGVMGLTPAGTTSFSDVSSNHWGAGYIAVLEREGIALGDHGKFHPNVPVTRAEFVAFLYRIIEKE